MRSPRSDAHSYTHNPGLGCAKAHTPATQPPTSTATPVVESASGQIDYAHMRSALLVPLGALIVSVRNKSGTTEGHLANFNAAAERILPLIERDMSTSASALHMEGHPSRDPRRVSGAEAALVRGSVVGAPEEPRRAPDEARVVERHQPLLVGHEGAD